MVWQRAHCQLKATSLPACPFILPCQLSGLREATGTQAEGGSSGHNSHQTFGRVHNKIRSAQLSLQVD